MNIGSHCFMWHADKNEPIASEWLNKLSGKVKSNKKVGILEYYRSTGVGYQTLTAKGFSTVLV